MHVLPLSPLRNGRCSCWLGASCPTPAKHPLAKLVPHGSANASSDLADVVRWWRAWPDAGVGIATGGGFFVLDVDPRNGGDESLAKLVAEHGELPQTVTQQTGGGGTHFLFSMPEGFTTRSPIAPGLDVKARGGLIVAEPSLHMSGNLYAWEPGLSPIDVPIARPPYWLVRLVVALPEVPMTMANAAPQSADVITRARRYVDTCDAAISGQNGHRTALWAAICLRRGFLLSDEQSLEILREYSRRCDPPWSERELIHKVASAAKARRLQHADGWLLNAIRGAA